MKALFKNIMPYKLNMDFPSNFSELLDKSEYKKEPLKGSEYETKGFFPLFDDVYYIHSNNCYLLQYGKQEKSPSQITIDNLVKERLSKLTEIISDSDPFLFVERTVPDIEEIKEQAERECLRYAPVKSEMHYLLLDLNNKVIYSSASTPAKAEDALNILRKVIGSLLSQPWDFCFPDQAFNSYITERANTDTSQPLHWSLPDCLTLIDGGIVKATGKNGAKAATDGICYTDPNLSVLLSQLVIKSLQMNYQEKADNDVEHKASFELEINSKTGCVFIKKLSHGDISISDGESISHVYSVQMLLISEYAWRIFKLLEQFFNEEEYE